MSSTNKLNLEFVNSKIPEFIDIIKDLCNISPTMMLKVNPEEILIYTLLMNGGQIHSLKSVILETAEFINYKSEEESFELVISDGDKLHKQMKHLEIVDSDGNPTKPIKWVVEYMDIKGLNMVPKHTIKNGDFKIVAKGGSPREIPNFKKEKIKELFDPARSLWGVDIGGKTVDKIKSLAAIFNDEDVVSMETLDNKIVFSEVGNGQWSLVVGEVDYVSLKQYRFKKKYLSNINRKSDVISIRTFPKFIMFSDAVSYLIIGFEDDHSDMVEDEMENEEF